MLSSNDIQSQISLTPPVSLASLDCGIAGYLHLSDLLNNYDTFSFFIFFSIMRNRKFNAL